MVRSAFPCSPKSNSQQLNEHLFPHPFFMQMHIYKEVPIKTPKDVINGSKYDNIKIIYKL